METKICTKCGLEFPAIIKYFKTTKSYKTKKIYLRNQCKICTNKEKIIWEKNNPEQIIKKKIYHDKWILTKSGRISNLKSQSKYNKSDKGKECRKNWIKNNPVKHQEIKIYNNTRLKNQRETLDDKYIKLVLKKYIDCINKSEIIISPEFIQSKKSQILLHRTIKKLQNGYESNENPGSYISQ